MYMRCDTCTYQGPPWSLKKDWPHNLVQRCSKFAVLCPKKYAPFKECRSLVFSGRVQGMDQIHQRRVGNVVKMGGVAKAGGSSNHWHVEQSDNIPIRPSEVGTRNHELITFKLCVMSGKKELSGSLRKTCNFNENLFCNNNATNHLQTKSRTGVFWPGKVALDLTIILMMIMIIIVILTLTMIGIIIIM